MSVVDMSATVKLEASHARTEAKNISGELELSDSRISSLPTDKPEQLNGHQVSSVNVQQDHSKIGIPNNIAKEGTATEATEIEIPIRSTQAASMKAAGENRQSRGQNEMPLMYLHPKDGRLYYQNPLMAQSSPVTQTQVGLGNLIQPRPSASHTHGTPPVQTSPTAPSIAWNPNYMTRPPPPSQVQVPYPMGSLAMPAYQVDAEIPKSKQSKQALSGESASLEKQGSGRQVQSSIAVSPAESQPGSSDSVAVAEPANVPKLDQSGSGPASLSPSESAGQPISETPSKSAREDKEKDAKNESGDGVSASVSVSDVGRQSILQYQHLQQQQQYPAAAQNLMLAQAQAQAQAQSFLHHTPPQIHVPNMGMRMPVNMNVMGMRMMNMMNPQQHHGPQPQLQMPQMYHIQSPADSPNISPSKQHLAYGMGYPNPYAMQLSRGQPLMPSGMPNMPYRVPATMMNRAPAAGRGNDGNPSSMTMTNSKQAPVKLKRRPGRPKLRPHPIPEGRDGNPGVGQRQHARVWTQNEDIMLTEALKKHGENWRYISQVVFMGSRSSAACSQHWRRVLSPDIRRGGWSIEEEQALNDAVAQLGEKAWSKVAEFVPGRTDIQCRYKWIQKKKGKKSRLHSSYDVKGTGNGNVSKKVKRSRSSDEQEQQGAGVPFEQTPRGASGSTMRMANEVEHEFGLEGDGGELEILEGGSGIE